jgi:hypothetical protein
VSMHHRGLNGREMLNGTPFVRSHLRFIIITIQN